MKAKTLAAGLLLAVPFWAAGQGALTPPAAPAPTMKALDQIEARTIVNAANTPGNASYTYVISQPGSYYLTGRIDGGAGTKGAINIASSNVSLDLNGFLVAGNLSNAAGISVSASASNVTVRNGRVLNWGTDGISAPTSAGTCIERIQSANNGAFQAGSGIVVGDSGHVTNCVASGNSKYGITGGSHCNVADCDSNHNANIGIYLGSGVVARCTSSQNGVLGIYLDSGGIVTDCDVANDGISISDIPTAGGIHVVGCTVSNSPGDGINTASGATIEGCSVSGSADFGINAASGATIRGCTVQGCTLAGFYAGAECTLADCTAYANHGAGNANGIVCDTGVTLSNCTASGNTGNGIVLGRDCLAQNCHASTNGGDGIVIASGFIGSSILNCNAWNNSHDGIHLIGSEASNRIEGNNTSGNAGIGIHQEGGPDLIVRNTARNNTSANYSPTTGSSVGPISANASTATSPWANFQ